MSKLAKILSILSFIAGIGFLLAAFFKFKQHKCCGYPVCVCFPLFPPCQWEWVRRNRLTQLKGEGLLPSDDTSHMWEEETKGSNKIISALLALRSLVLLFCVPQQFSVRSSENLTRVVFTQSCAQSTPAPVCSSL
jgi:hypothetical protein